jgi:hypothetical protein
VIRAAPIWIRKKKRMRKIRRLWRDNDGVIPRMNPQVIPRANEILPVSEFNNLMNANNCLSIRPIVSPSFEWINFRKEG